MITFLAYAGTRAGQQIAAALSSDVGRKAAVAGVAVTSTVGLLLLVLGRRLNHLGGTEHAGVVGGAATQPAVPALANEPSGFDARVGLATCWPTPPRWSSRSCWRRCSPGSRSPVRRP